ncbi:MAG: YigZ family protein [Spirochaetia bacterium]|nr:YigZ family protein [Spirochaetia bacterium]
MRVPTATRQTELEVKRSRFISYAYPITGRDEIKPLIRSLWKEHPQASHIVQAFILGEHGDIFGMSDDHEPKNTAGRPALEVLRGSDLTDILILIVRYFGGTKLGTGGLVKAYTEAAQQVIAGLPSEEQIIRRDFSVSLPYDLYQPVHTLLLGHGADMIQETFATAVEITGRIPESSFAAAAQEILDRSAGACALTSLDRSE